MPKNVDGIYSIEVELKVWEVANSETSSCSAWYNSISILDALAHILWLANLSRTTLADSPRYLLLVRVSHDSVPSDCWYLTYRKSLGAIGIPEAFRQVVDVRLREQ